MSEDDNDQKKQPPPEEVREFFRQIGKKYGAMGGHARKQRSTRAKLSRDARKAGKQSGKNLTPEQRRERAQKAAAARYRKPEEPPAPAE